MAHIGIRNTCRNAEAEQKDKQGWIIIFFRGPKTDVTVMNTALKRLKFTNFLNKKMGRIQNMFSKPSHKHLIILAFTLVLALTLLPLSSAIARTIKIASIAPDGTVWMKKMRAGAEEIKRRTEGRVKFKFYPGGIMGSDQNVLRKMRIGQLHGGAITAGSLAAIYPDVQIYSLPLIFDNRDELNFVRQHMDHTLIEGLDEHGYVSFGFAEGGFAYFMSKAPIRDLSDLRQQRVWLPEGDEFSRVWFESADVSPIPLPLTDVLTGLQTGLVGVIGTSPIGAVAFQWHTKVRYLTNVPLMYIYATLVIDKKTFGKLKPEDQAVVRQVMGEVYKELDNINRNDSENALQALRSQGIEFVSPSDDALARIRKSADEAQRRLLGMKAFTPAALETLQENLKTSRSGS